MRDVKPHDKKVYMLGITLDNVSMQEAVAKIRNLAEHGLRDYVVTPNVDHIVRFNEDTEFQKVYENASLVLADGQPLLWLGKLYGTPLKEKVSGSDLFPRICKMAGENGLSVFLLGADKGVAQKAADNLRVKYPNLRIAGVYSPTYGFENDEMELDSIIKLINATSPDILCIGLGSPKQEKFYYHYGDCMNVPVTLHIGASIDFEAGNIKRAPRWMSRCGLEWFYRLCKEPRRLFRRYLIQDMKVLKLIWLYRGMHQK